MRDNRIKYIDIFEKVKLKNIKDLDLGDNPVFSGSQEKYRRFLTYLNSLYRNLNFDLDYDDEYDEDEEMEEDGYNDNGEDSY